jgi:hypothetical protein
MLLKAEKVLCTARCDRLLRPGSETDDGHPDDRQPVPHPHIPGRHPYEKFRSLAATRSSIRHTGTTTRFEAIRVQPARLNQGNGDTNWPSSGTRATRRLECSHRELRRPRLHGAHSWLAPDHGTAIIVEFCDALTDCLFQAPRADCPHRGLAADVGIARDTTLRGSSTTATAAPSSARATAGDESRDALRSPRLSALIARR